jgi:hypothetical protein
MAESDFQAEPPGDRPPRRPAPRGKGERSDFEKDPGPRSRPARRPRRDYDEEEDDLDVQRDAVETLIPYRNPKGLVAYYLGVFSVICGLGLLLGPAALVLGIMGLRHSQRYPRAGGAGHAITGIVLGALSSLVNWGVLIVLLVTYFASRR